MLEQLDLLREQYGTATLVVWAAFVVGIFFGAVAEYSRYCARAALAEWAPGAEREDASANGYVRTKQYLAAVLVALLGTQALFATQNIDLAQSIYWSVGIQPLALVTGGVLFGIGMVLAGGCVSRLLVLAASGNGRSLVTLIVTGIAGYATLRGLLSYPRIWLGDAADTGTTVASVYSAASVSHLAVAGVIGAVLLALLTWAVSRHGVRGMVTGALVGLSVVAGWAVAGIVGFDEFEPTQLQSLSFVAPVGESLQYLMIFTGVSANYVIALLGGVLAGAFGSALIGGRLRFRGFQSEGSLLRYIAGGVLMGFGGVTALGCSVGQGLSGLSTASFASVIAVLAIAGGGYAAMAVEARRRVQQTGNGLNTALQPAE
ncbi:MAG: YeeE/YedE family protein [Anderseniella sp.]|nr:YeeE/YedE family protein [Anderseniella sp.]